MLNTKGYEDVDTVNTYEKGIEFFKTVTYDFPVPVVIDY